MGRSYRQFNAAKRFLINNLDFSPKVQILRTKVPQDRFADCIYIKGTFRIRLSNILDEDAAILFLIHELGHVLAWEKDGSDHGPNWGKCYAAIYRKYLEFLDHE